jgi:phosphohistidine phosphatase
VDLLVVRHAIAEERDAFAQTGNDDAERPLTSEGRRKFQRAARGLRKMVDSVDLLATSTLVRAIQTGEILEAPFGIEAAARLPELAPDADPSSLLRWLRRRHRHRVVAVVGHEPHLSHLIGYLLAGRSLGLCDLKKGGASLLALGTAPEPGRAKLQWLLTAGQLRRLGR